VKIHEGQSRFRELVGILVALRSESAAELKWEKLAARKFTWLGSQFHLPCVAFYCLVRGRLNISHLGTMGILSLDCTVICPCVFSDVPTWHHHVWSFCLFQCHGLLTVGKITGL
jgi:hypothetical protein